MSWDRFLSVILVSFERLFCLGEESGDEVLDWKLLRSDKSEGSEF